MPLVLSGPWLTDVDDVDHVYGMSLGHFVQIFAGGSLFPVSSYVFPTTFSMCFGLLCLFQFRGCLTVTLTAPTAPPTTFPLHSTSFPRPSSQWRNLEWIDYIPLQVAMDYCPIAKKWCSKLCQLPRLQQEDGQIDKTYSIDSAGKTFELIQSVRHMCFGLLQLALGQATLLRVIFPRHYSHYALKHVPDTTSLS
jgi:hypothetical protein